MSPVPCFQSTCSVELSFDPILGLAADVVLDDEGGLSCVDGEGVGISVPAVKVYRAAALNHTNSGSHQVISWDTADYDTAAMHVAGTQLVAPIDGLYRVDANARFDVDPTGKRYTGIRKNGVATTLYRSDAATIIGGDGTSQPISFIMKLLAGDYIEVTGFQNSGGNLAYNVGNPDAVAASYAALTWVSRF